MTNKTSSSSPQKSSSSGEKKSLGKIRLDTGCLDQGGGGGCPAEKFLYVIFAFIGKKGLH